MVKAQTNESEAIDLEALKNGEAGLAPAGDIEIAYRAWGDGPPLLLIVGLGGVKELWTEEFIRPLARSFRVIAFDNRGTGETPRGSLPFTISQFARDAARLLDALEIRRTHILGYSMGGYIAQELALEEPWRAERLILVGTECGGARGVRNEPGILLSFAGSSPDSGGDGKTEERFYLSSEWLDENAGQLGNLFGGLPDQVAPGSIGLQADAIRDWNGTCERLPEVDKPTLVVTGTDDIVILPENARVLSELIPGSELVEVEGGHHGLILQYPEELATIVAGFLAKHT